MDLRDLDVPKLLPDHVGKSPTKQTCAWQEILLYSLQSAACFTEHRPAFLSIRAHTQQCAPLEVLESPLMSIACRIDGICLVYKPFQSALLRYQIRSLSNTFPIISALNLSQTAWHATSSMPSRVETEDCLLFLSPGAAQGSDLRQPQMRIIDQRGIDQRAVAAA